MVLSRKLYGAVALVAVLGVAMGDQTAGASGRRTDPPGTRTVVEGDTLSAVARSLGVSVASLAAANGITDIHRVRAGTRLLIPDGGAPTMPKGAAPATVKVSAALPERLRAQPQRLALLPAFDAAAAEFGIPADLFKAMTWLESGWQNEKVSSTRAVGIGQLMPDTVAFVNGLLLRAKLDPKKPEHNIRMSARFLAYLLHQNGGDAVLALSSYYQGLASVRRQGALPETRHYVANVLALRQKF
ncbi:MAG TPA: transglycosylase SLT domain-containing protein [Acidimicrobiales bacterium]|nr:transglycosylase SLT domain-containing protein [Acidimicrobiales bacterium]